MANDHRSVHPHRAASSHLPSQTSPTLSRKARGATGAVAVGVLLVGCITSTVVQGSGERRRDVRALPPFERVRVEAPVSVLATEGEGSEVALEGDGDLLHLLRTEVRGGTLVVFESCDGCELRHSARPELSIPVRLLRNVSLGGEATLRISNQELRALRVEATREAQLTLENVRVEGTLDLSISQDARVSATGRAEGIRVDAEDDGFLDLSGLVVARAELELEDDAAVAADVTDSVEAKLEDASSLTLRKRSEDFRVSSDVNARLRFLQ